MLTSDPACKNLNTLSIKRSTSCYDASLKYSAAAKEACVTRILLPGVSVIIGQLLRILYNSLPKEKDLAIYFTKPPLIWLNFEEVLFVNSNFREYSLWLGWYLWIICEFLFNMTCCSWKMKLVDYEKFFSLT